MSLKPPSLWLEQRGRQHRVYWRNAAPGLPRRSYLPFCGRDVAQDFVSSAALLGLDTARQVFTTEDPHAATALLQAAWGERGLAPADPMPMSRGQGCPHQDRRFLGGEFFRAIITDAAFG
jgi:hypothetical protein